jgi:uncharacterized protein YjbI with pentapeptide repeats
MEAHDHMQFGVRFEAWRREVEMANEEQLAILRQGVEVWNEWRKENPRIKIDLSEAKLVETDLNTANLTKANLNLTNMRKADLRNAHLSRAHLRGAYLRRADLSKARLSRAYLSGANLRDTNLCNANLKGADLSGSYLREAYLRATNLMGADLNQAYLAQANLLQVDLREANLIRANLLEADLRGSNFSRAAVGNTIFGSTDLREVIGLNEVRHMGPSPISTSSFALSKGKIPEAFLRGCGLSDWEIESVKLYNPDLNNNEFIDIQNRIFDLRNRQALQINPLFISYSHADGIFVEKLENYLNSKGIRFWRDVHDATSGKLEKVIDRAMRLSPTVLLILSQNSLKSDWVEHEVRTARELEKEMGRDVLCPVTLDDSWKDNSWPKRLMEQVMEYNILDFSAWEDDEKFEGMFRKLIDGLELFYKR